MNHRQPIRIQPRTAGTATTVAPKTARGTSLRLVPDPNRQMPALPLPVPPRQKLPLSPAYRAKQACELRARIRHYLDAELLISVTDNSAVMLTVRRQPQFRRYTVRLHHLFYDAPNEIIAALAHYIETNDLQASTELNRYIDAQDYRIADTEPAPPRNITLRTAGQVFDLKRLYDSLNDHYFNNTLTTRLTWGRYATPGRSRNTVRLGSYCYEEDLIRIHPGLDQRWVPRYYLEWVLFHEMLHAHLPTVECNGRRQFHTPEFLQLERQFRHYAAAAEWERYNLPALLRI